MWQLWRNFDDFSEKHALVFSNFTRLSPPRRRILAGVIFFVIPTLPRRSRANVAKSRTIFCHSCERRSAKGWSPSGWNLYNSLRLTVWM